MTLVACSCPKSQLGLIPLTLFSVIKNFLWTYLLSPDSVCLSQRVEKVGEPRMQYTVQVGTLLPKAMTWNNNALQMSRHYALLSKATFVCNVPSKTSFPYNPSVDACNWGFHSGSLAVSQGIKSISLCFWPLTILFFLFVLFFILMGKI